MGTPKKNNSRPTQQSKKGKKKPQIIKMKSDDEEEVDDVMAWGKKRSNYYRQDEDEYSQLSEEEKEAEEIYKNKYDNYMNDEEAYDIPADKEEEKATGKKGFEAEYEENADVEEKLPEEYVSQELEWVLELFKDLQFYEENNLQKIYEKLLKSYLTVIISIKELKIPYIQYHPIIPMAVDIKAKITLLMKKLTVKPEDDEPQVKNIKSNKKNKNKGAKSNQNHDQDIEDEHDELLDEQQENSDQQDLEGQQQWSSNQQPVNNKKSNLKPYPDHCSQATKSQKEEHKKGIQFYNQMKTVQQQQKKEKKQQKREERKLKQKPAFKKVGENEGRFASQLILKNKGLIKKRKKIEGNSRLKLRKKYQKKKAIHRARSGHFIRQNPGRAYQGESNIRTGKIAGVKLK